MSTALNNSKVTAAIHEMLKKDPTLSELKFHITRAEMINQDYTRVPWIGIYKGDTQYEARTLGAGSGIRNFLATSKPQIIVQAYSHVSGIRTEELLEEYIEEVFRVIDADRTIQGTVSMINGYTIENEYWTNNVREGVQENVFFFQQATITLEVEVRK